MPTTVISDLTCEYQINPLGIDVLHPRLAWQMQSDQRGAYQTAYQILVANSETALAAVESCYGTAAKLKPINLPMWFIAVQPLLPDNGILES
jgi:alpha-L-rhamnosidase